jgi:hypothetical protein
MNLKNKKLWFIIPFFYLVIMNFLLYLVEIQMAAMDSSAWLGFPFRAYSLSGGMCVGTGMCPPQFYPLMALADFATAILWPYAIYSLKTKQLRTVIKWSIYLSFIPIILMSLFYFGQFYWAWY